MPTPPLIDDLPSLRRFVRIGEVSRMTGLPPSTVYQKMSDGSFPRSIRLGPRGTAWLEEELIDWQRARLAERQNLQIIPQQK